MVSQGNTNSCNISNRLVNQPIINTSSLLNVRVDTTGIFWNIFNLQKKKIHYYHTHILNYYWSSFISSRFVFLQKGLIELQFDDVLMIFASFVMCLVFFKYYFSILTITVTCILPHLWSVSIAKIVQMTDYE
jgi:hypothetical protein